MTVTQTFANVGDAGAVVECEDIEAESSPLAVRTTRTTGTTRNTDTTYTTRHFLIDRAKDEFAASTGRVLDQVGGELSDHQGGLGDACFVKTQGLAKRANQSPCFAGMAGVLHT